MIAFRSRFRPILSLMLASARQWLHGRTAARRSSGIQYADCGLGILTERTPAIDIDVLDEALAGKIQGAAERALGGDPPWRVGQWPKRLLLYRLSGEAFSKIKVTWRGLGDRLHEPTRPPAVEILARGQQFVAIGLHPGTGQPYRWHRDPWLSLPRCFLPPLSYAKAVRFMRALAFALEQSGATDVKLRGIREPKAKLARPERKPGLWRSDARSGRRRSRGRTATAICTTTTGCVSALR